MRQMRFINYEAWHGEIPIYNGSSRKSMVDELLDFVDGIDEIDESEVKALDIEALSGIGIKIYINEW